jgi:biotin/methionine sulfoxide reductase
VLARDVGTSRLAQGPSALSVLVEVERYAADAPAPRSYLPPELIADAASL